MITQVFSLFDTKAGIYGQPFFMQHVSQAVRAVQDLCSDGETTVGRHPADFTLCRLGQFDDNTGAFAAEYQNIGPCVSFIERRHAAPPLLGMMEEK
jgi:hypothetical protein